MPGELWKNQLWNQWNPRPGKHQSVIHYPLVSELLCWQKLFLMTITSPQPLTHTGLHYRKHGATESQFLQAATGLGFIPSCHYLPTSLQELLPCLCWYLVLILDARAAAGADGAQFCGSQGWAKMLLRSSLRYVWLLYSAFHHIYLSFG